MAFPVRGYVLALLLAQTLLILVRSLATGGVFYAQLRRVHEVTNAQFFMFIFSWIIYRRVCRCFSSTSSHVLRDACRALALLALLFAHICWLFFYIFLHDDYSWLALLSFLSIALYIHTVFFMVLVIGLERASAFLHLRFSHFFLRSSTLHTMLALVLAFWMTLAGLFVTSMPPVVREIAVPIRDLPAHLHDFRLVLLTDVHIGPTVNRERVEQIVAITNRLSPDIVAVAIAGDLVDGFVENIGAHALPLAGLATKYGTFFATGNHEYYHGDVDAWFRFLNRTTGMKILHNSNEKIARYLCIAGVDDAWSDHLYIPGHGLDVSRALAGCEDDMPVVLLVHQPNAAKKILDMPGVGNKIDLILSGHTHGGQMYVLLPFAYLTQAYLHGLYSHRESGAHVYVSAGVNYWGAPVKMWGLCEITLITLQRPM